MYWRVTKEGKTLISLYLCTMYIPYIPEYTLHTLIVYMGMGPNGPKRPIFGPKCQFLAKFGRFWAQNPIFWGQGVKILVPSYRDSNETPFSC